MTQRRTWAYSTSLLAGYCGLTGATGIAVAAGGTRRPGTALAILAVATLLLATRAKPLTAPALGVLALLFYAGFIAGRHGSLTWQGTGDVWRFGLLAGSAVLGAGLSWLTALSWQTALSWLTARFPRGHPAAGEQSGEQREKAVVISLVEARAGRRA
jgi:hypothetical protein